MLRFLARATPPLLSLAVCAALRAQEAAPSPVPTTLPQTVTAPGVPAAATGPTLTLPQCVAEALAKNFAVQIQTFAVDQARAGVIIAQSTYDPILGVNWQRAVNKSPYVETQLVQNTVAANSTTGAAATTTTSVITEEPQSDNQSTNLSATQNLVTGGQVVANYNLGRDQSAPASQFLDPAYLGTASLSVSQPLLAGAGPSYARAQIQIAQLGAKISALGFKSSVLSTIYNVQTAYFNVIFARQQYVVDQDAVKLAQQLLDENSVKRKTGVLTDLDVVQAQAGLASANTTLISAKQALDNNEDILLEAMGTTDFTIPVGSIELPPAETAEVSFDFSYKLARDNGPNLAIVEATIEQYQLDALRAKINNRPQLGVTGGAGYLTARDSYYNAATKVWSGPGYNWQAGLSLSFPWGLRQNKALYRQAMDSVKAEQTTLDQSDQALTVQVRAAVRAVQANRQSVDSSVQNELLSQKQYELQKAKFDAGLATSYDVLQAQDQLESARVTRIQSEVNLRIAIADVHFLEGTSLDQYHVDLKP
jgi:outer membrane protein